MPTTIGAVTGVWELIHFLWRGPAGGSVVMLETVYWLCPAVQSLVLCGPNTQDMLEALTRMELLRRNVVAKALDYRESPVACFESTALKLSKSCSGPLPELSGEGAEDKSIASKWINVSETSSL